MKFESCCFSGTIMSRSYLDLSKTLPGVRRLGTFMNQKDRMWSYSWLKSARAGEVAFRMWNVVGCKETEKWKRSCQELNCRTMIDRISVRLRSGRQVRTLTPIPV